MMTIGSLELYHPCIAESEVATTESTKTRRKKSTIRAIKT